MENQLDDQLEDQLDASQRIALTAAEYTRRARNRKLSQLRPTTWDTIVRHEAPSGRVLTWDISDPMKPYHFTEDEQTSYDKTDYEFERFMKEAKLLAMKGMLQKQTVLTADTFENVKKEVDFQWHFTGHDVANLSIVDNASQDISGLKCRRQGESTCCPVVTAMENRQRALMEARRRRTQTSLTEMKQTSQQVWHGARRRLLDRVYTTADDMKELEKLAGTNPDFFTTVLDWESTI